MEKSPAVLDSDVIPSVDASTQQTSTSTTNDAAYTTAVKASPTVLDLGTLPSVDASTQQTSTSTTIE
eukprot:15336607-Ditylum_brightwellii.AAC.1